MKPLPLAEKPYYNASDISNSIEEDDIANVQLELAPQIGITTRRRPGLRPFTTMPSAVLPGDGIFYWASMDKVIVVACDEEQSIQRGMKNCSLTREEAISRIQSQMPQVEKIKKADYVLQNDGSQKDFKIKVQALHSKLKALI